MSINNGVSRWVLCDELQKCLWSDIATFPEVDICFAVQLKTFESEREAIIATENQLSEMGAKATYADVRPVEECACCGTDFETSQYHHVLAVSEEQGTEYSPIVLSCMYLARFCINCVPIQSTTISPKG